MTANNPDYMNAPANTIVIKSLINKYKCTKLTFLSLFCYTSWIET